MIKRYLLNRYREDLLFGLLQEMFGQIPSDVSEPALEGLTDKSMTVNKWLMWMAFWFQKKAIDEPAAATRYHDWILLIKLQLSMLDRAKHGVVERADGPAESQVPARSLDDDLTGVRDFMNKKKQTK